MKLLNLRSGLENLITQLENAEKRYYEIALAINDDDLKSILNQISVQRKEMRQVLEIKLQAVGGRLFSPINLKEEIHHAYIDVKLNHIDWSIEAVISEINRGAGEIVKDYSQLINKIDYHPDIKRALIRQKDIIQEELMLFQELAY